jgi:hypothetical protein
LITPLKYVVTWTPKAFLDNGSINTFQLIPNSGNYVRCGLGYKFLGDAILLTTEESIFYVVLAATVAVQRLGKQTSTVETAFCAVRAAAI